MLRKIGLAVWICVFFGAVCYASMHNSAQRNTALLGSGHNEEYLPPDKAFSVTLVNTEGGNAKLKFSVAPGYYLYRDKFHIITPAGEVPLTLPGGKVKYDPTFGKQEVYTQDVLAEVDISIEMPSEIEIKYQGCSERGLCYPPTSKSISLANQITEMTAMDLSAL